MTKSEDEIFWDQKLKIIFRETKIKSWHIYEDKIHLTLKINIGNSTLLEMWFDNLLSSTLTFVWFSENPTLHEKLHRFEFRYNFCMI